MVINARLEHREIILYSFINEKIFMDFCFMLFVKF